ncbi:unnamed protein product [Plutella xylostella]|uniref:(diamondback moth) hypothetical protein n=1 Tax=Plutella xylostella TaxID=51655 RepID=A0A8S4GFU3_PLUXY|nr:unnamed protein product [Plutella xylostella]
MLNATLFARVILGSNNIVGGVTVGILPCATSKTNGGRGGRAARGVTRRRTETTRDMKLITGEICVRTSAVVVALAGGASARVAGKMGGYSNHAHGKSTSGINEEIIWISISMAIAIAVLIAIALCYILKEKCDKRRAYREQS